MALIHLDAGVVIGLLDADDTHHGAATDALAQARLAGDRLAMAASAFAECLVGPSRSGERAVTVVRELVDRLPILIVPLDADTAAVAAGLRARHRRLRLPDALVLATAAQHRADRLVTTDRGWPTRSDLGLDLEIAAL
jgi:predicted nucleic acid-binding protein